MAISIQKIQAMHHQLRNHLAGDLRTDLYSRVLYSTDASLYQLMPVAVVMPKTTDDLQAVLAAAHEFQVPVLLRGGGSSLAGQSVNEAVVLDCSRYLDKIIEISPEERWARVQPGVILDELNLALRPHRLAFGPDPASGNRATMAGIIANNSTGAHSILYGMAVDHLLEMEAILSDGSKVKFTNLKPAEVLQAAQKPGLEGKIYREISSIIQNGQRVIEEHTPRHWRRSGGYNLDRFVPGTSRFDPTRLPGFNLAELVCGSEGTLAGISELKVSLVPLPPKTGLAILGFSNLHDSLSAVVPLLDASPSAIELLDHLSLTLSREIPEYARLLSSFLTGNPYCLLVVEFFGESEAEITEKLSKLERIIRNNHLPCSFTPLVSPDLQGNVWKVRKAGLGLIMSSKGDQKPVPFIEDAAVPPEHLAEYILKLEEYCQGLGVRITYYAHASAGCLHVRPLMNTKAAQEIARMPDIARFSMELVGKYGGALSSEHGDGRTRSWLNREFFGEQLYSLYQQVKTAFDPQNLLNPGNIVDAPAMTDSRRYGDQYQAVAIHEHLDFSGDQGLIRAIELCNGAAVCRKKQPGGMCPSYMVTLEEEHSTRGRANLLRAALTGWMDPLEFTSPRMYQAMDLCVECKACKSECPSAVDMAKIKVEYLAHYYETHGVPMRARFFGAMPAMNRWLSGPVANLVNPVVSNSVIKAVLSRTLGLAEQRSFPAFSPQPFTTRRVKTAHLEPKGRRVVLFTDTFNNYNSPQTLEAAYKVMDAAGYDVILSRHGCCGRPMISKGLVNEARQAARKTVQHLVKYAQEGLFIVGLEPSCILSMRDEYYDLLHGDERVPLVAEKSLLFEEWILHEHQAGNLDLKFTQEPLELLLHTHCHTKSLVGSGPALQMLSLPKNYKVQEVDSGCCGMAGAFGYEKEHYEISMQMAERRLLPAVRDHSENGAIVAAGISCRQQIKHGTGRQALHPAEILYQAIEKE